MAMVKTIKNKQTALEAFLQNKAEIEAKLARLTALAEEHFDTNPDDLNWADVGTLAHMNTQLTHITDFMFNEEEGE